MLQRFAHANQTAVLFLMPRSQQERNCSRICKVPSVGGSNAVQHSSEGLCPRLHVRPCDCARVERGGAKLQLRGKVGRRYRVGCAWRGRGGCNGSRTRRRSVDVIALASVIHWTHYATYKNDYFYVFVWHVCVFAFAEHKSLAASHVICFV